MNDRGGRLDRCGVGLRRQDEVELARFEFDGGAPESLAEPPDGAAPPGRSQGEPSEVELARSADRSFEQGDADSLSPVLGRDDDVHAPCAVDPHEAGDTSVDQRREAESSSLPEFVEE